jgi:pyridoxal phosphate enzyme (YggS family)
VVLIAVTKGVSIDGIRAAVAAGVQNIGENRVQEAQQKRDALTDLPQDVVWHMIGHLQTNKVQSALNLFDIIHSVDSIHLAEAISRRAQKTAPVSLEVNVSAEPSKYGLSLDELKSGYRTISQLPHIDVRGLMTVAPPSESAEEARPVFRALREAADGLGLRELSMGMSDDFEVAVQEGATHVRIGRAIFGERS